MNSEQPKVFNERKFDPALAHRRLALWFPLIVIAAAIIAADLVLRYAKHLNPSRVNYYAQILFFALFSLIIYGVIRSRSNRETRKLQIKELMHEQDQLDSHRDDFINHVMQTIAPDIARLVNFAQSVPANSPAAKNIREGIKRFYAVLQKFKILTSLEETKKGSESENTDEEFIDLTDIANSIVQDLQAEIESKQLQVELPEESVYVLAGEALITQILESVIGNAVKFNNQGGKIKVSLRQNMRDWMVNIKIADTGKGVTVNELNRLFEPFNNAGANPEIFNNEGLGFNLYLNKVIIDYLGGNIQALSNTPSGLIISIQLPVRGHQTPSDEQSSAEEDKDNTKALKENNETPVNSSSPMAGNIFTPQE